MFNSEEDRDTNLVSFRRGMLCFRGGDIFVLLRLKEELATRLSRHSSISNDFTITSIVKTEFGGIVTFICGEVSLSESISKVYHGEHFKAGFRPTFHQL